MNIAYWSYVFCVIADYISLYVKIAAIPQAANLDLDKLS